MRFRDVAGRIDEKPTRDSEVIRHKASSSADHNGSPLLRPLKTLEV
jgi:hypothetical protein